MRMLLALLPLLGFVAAQMNQPGRPAKGGFFNDMGQSTSTLPPWAEPAPQAGGAGRGQNAALGGNVGGSQSSTSPPVHAAAPIGNPQLPAAVGANADPGKSGGSSGGLTGFGAHDYYNGGGPDVLSPQAAAPAPGGGRNTNQNSGPFGLDESDIPGGMYEAAYNLMQQTMHNGQILPGELGGGIGIGAGPGSVPGKTSGEKINPDYFGIGGGAGVGGGRGANHGPNGGNQGMMGAGQVPSTGNGGRANGGRANGGMANGGMTHGGGYNPGHDTAGMGGVGPQAPGRSSGEIHHFGTNQFDAGGGGGMHHNPGNMGAGGGGGRFNNLLGGEDEKSGNSGTATAAGIAAGALIVAAAVGGVAFIIVRKRKHSRLFNSA